MDVVLSHAHELVTAPAIEPVSLTQAKRWLGLEENNYFDAQVDELIEQARDKIETVLNRALITQTWKYYLDRWPTQITLPKAPLQSVTHVKYTDADGDEQTWDAANYEVDANHEPGVIRRAYDVMWPEKRADKRTIEVQYVAGYGDAASDLPPMAVSAMRFWMADVWNGGTGETDGFWAAVESLRY